VRVRESATVRPRHVVSMRLPWESKIKLSRPGGDPTTSTTNHIIIIISLAQKYRCKCCRPDVEAKTVKYAYSTHPPSYWPVPQSIPIFSRFLTCSRVSFSLSHPRDSSSYPLERHPDHHRRIPPPLSSSPNAGSETHSVDKHTLPRNRERVCPTRHHASKRHVMGSCFEKRVDPGRSL
jgi:hypothetical protein